MDKVTQNYIINHARQVFGWSDLKKICKAEARISPTIYMCALCGQAICDRYTGHSDSELSAFGDQNIMLVNGKVKVDHIDPVVCLEKGFQGWTVFYDRMFCDQSNLQCICDVCHYLKTFAIEKPLRTYYSKRRLTE